MFGEGPLLCICAHFFFLNVRPLFLHVSLYVRSLLRGSVQVQNPACSEVICRLVACLTSFALFVCVCVWCSSQCMCARSVMGCVDVLLQAQCVFFKFWCPCVPPYVCVCSYDPRPFNSTTWIHPISWSPWLPRALITEGPGRSNRCASWRCLSSTPVARNLCCTQCTGACRHRQKPAGGQNIVLMSQSELLCVFKCVCSRTWWPCVKQCEL